MKRRKSNYFIEQGYHTEYKELIESSFSKTEISELNKTALVIVKPDAIVSGKGNKIVKWLEARSILVVDVLPILIPKKNNSRNCINSI